MLGNAVYKAFSNDGDYEVWGSLRESSGLEYFPDTSHSRLVVGANVLDQDAIQGLLDRVRPAVVVNGVGLVKQLAESNDPLCVLPVNALFPHRLARLASLVGARMIQLSTDCVYSGRKGNYREEDPSDAEDLYGKSKYIGEIHSASHVITLRTSGIGHEMGTHRGLLEWFLSQEGSAKGFARAIYSGLTSVELGKVIKEYVIPRPTMHGLYHVSATAISKLELLRLVASKYKKKIEIVPDDTLALDRSLNSDRFKRETGYRPPDWPELIDEMQRARAEGAHEYAKGNHARKRKS